MSEIDRNTEAVRAVDRRQFVRTAAAATAAASVLPGSARGGFHHSVDDRLRIGLVGCGGRGTGAVVNACNADSNVRVTALADAFPDRIESSLRQLRKDPVVGGRLEVTPDTCFSGLDCAKQLVASDVDVVLLCQPPFFRPSSLKLAVEAGKHVFCEKPVGVDVPGVLSVMETCRNAGALSIVSGLCWRYDLGVRATIERIQSGEIGDILSIQENYLAGELWHRGRKPEWSELEYQMRNWLYFTWLSGDIVPEQHIHSLDKAVWMMGDEPPARAYGVGGRQKRTGPEFGNIYDHFSVCFEWANGVRAHYYGRQMNDCFNQTEDFVVGTHGRARILEHVVEGKSGIWQYDGPKPTMYDVEHEYLFRSIRDGKPINNGHYMGISSLTAILGRQAGYTGQIIEWDDFVRDQTRLGPTITEFGDYDPGPVAIPGTGGQP